ncbi:glycosyltransferase 87 family protein [Streptomyces sp. NPDC047028]|uniref:glycosyltransferase 87 family protein n=1 Tax=Streptomyces sp. NPDC047028 TaxID=3155793 RepID=UPI0033C8F060
MASSTGRHVGWPLLAWTASRTVLLLSVFAVLPFPGPDAAADLWTVYPNWYDVLATGRFPVGDVTWQYPPAAAIAVLAPAPLLPLLGYAAAFVLILILADACVLLLLLRAGQPWRKGSLASPPGAAGEDGTTRTTGAWFWVVGVPLLGPTAYARYDLLVTAVVVAALLVGVGRPRLLGAAAGLGALLKGWPLLLLLGIRRGRCARLAWVSAAVVMAALTLLFTLLMPGALAFLGYQRRRGMEIESVGALVFHVARHLGWSGGVQPNYGCMEFMGPYVELVSMASVAMTVACTAWLAVGRLRARVYSAATLPHSTLTAVLLFILTSRVISPQYLLWLIGVVAVCLILPRPAMLRPAVLILLATALTTLEFPVWFGHVVDSDWIGISLLVCRNGLLITAAVLSGRQVWQETVAPGARRPAMDLASEQPNAQLIGPEV